MQITSVFNTVSLTCETGQEQQWQAALLRCLQNGGKLVFSVMPLGDDPVSELTLAINVKLRLADLPTEEARNA